MGFDGRAVEQQTRSFAGEHSQGKENDGYLHINANVSVAPEAVYDILNAGPRSRFVVRGATGPIIVHNCIENVCQALACCIIKHQMNLISPTYRVVMTVHDAIGVVVPDAEVIPAKLYIEEVMRTSPDWAPGLALNCESGYGQSYGDC